MSGKRGEGLSGLGICMVKSRGASLAGTAESGLSLRTSIPGYSRVNQASIRGILGVLFKAKVVG